MQFTQPTIKGRGAAVDPKNRFERLAFAPDGDAIDAGDVGGARETLYLKDHTRSIVTRHKSPDVMIEASINPYRGCEHGCAYCFARPTHEFLGFSAGLDFESRIVVKEDAPELLRRELSDPKYARNVDVMSISGVTDCYQPIERKLQLTRRCIQVLAEFRNPVGVITKNHLVTRDADVLGEMAQWNGAVAILSVTTLDADLSRTLEPRASVPRDRLAAIEELTKAGVPMGVMVAPVIPGLTDHEMPRILQAAADAGARFAGYVPLRLPWAVAPLFEDWLTRHCPDRKDKVLNRVRKLRGGKLYDATWETRMTGQGLWAEQFSTIFELAKRRAGLDQPMPPLSKQHFRVPGGQMRLFDG
jgi:DNA repair photolyase